MTSIYEQAMGPAFQQLHPAIRQRLDLHSGRPLCFKAQGIMTRVRNAGWFMAPLLALAQRRHMMMPGQGHQVPFTLRLYAYKDGLGRETVAWLRQFDFPEGRQWFDTFTVLHRGSLIDWFGTHQQMGSLLTMQPTPQGGFIMRAPRQWLQLGRRHLPLPRWLTGVALATEVYNEKLHRFEIDVSIRHPVLGTLLYYSGWYVGEVLPCPPEEIPAEAFARRCSGE